MTTDKAMDLERQCAVLWYGCHSSASRDTAFVRAELRGKTSMGHIIVLLWENVWDLPGHRLSPLGLISQEGHCPRIIYYAHAKSPQFQKKYHMGRDACEGRYNIS